MKIFKEIGIANQSQINNFIKDERIIRLSNTVMIDTNEMYLFVKYDNKLAEELKDPISYDSLYEKDFVTVSINKKLSAEYILYLYNKNIRIVDDNTFYGKKVFAMRMSNQD